MCHAKNPLLHVFMFYTCVHHAMLCYAMCHSCLHEDQINMHQINMHHVMHPLFLSSNRQTPDWLLQQTSKSATWHRNSEQKATNLDTNQKQNPILPHVYKLWYINTLRNVTGQMYVSFWKLFASQKFAQEQKMALRYVHVCMYVCVCVCVPTSVKSDMKLMYVCMYACMHLRKSEHVLT